MSVLLLSKKDDFLASKVAELTSKGAANALTLASLSALSGIPEADLALRFSSWEDLAESVLGYYEISFHNYAHEKLRKNSDFFVFFSAILDWCLSDPYRTRFILQQSPLIPYNGQKEEFEAFQKKIIFLWSDVEKENNVLARYVSLDGWIVFLRGVFMDSTYFISGMFPDTPVFRREMGKLLQQGLEGYLL